MITVVFLHSSWSKSSAQRRPSNKSINISLDVCTTAKIMLLWLQCREVRDPRLAATARLFSESCCGCKEEKNMHRILRQSANRGSRALNQTWEPHKLKLVWGIYIYIYIYDPSARPQTKELFEILWNYQGESLEAIWCCLQSANATAGSISAVMMMMMTKAIAKMMALTLKPASASRSCPDTGGVMSRLNWNQMDPSRTITNL